jgi:hypothetical protein
MSRVLALIGVLVLSGCYAYFPQRPGAVPLGADVRLQLSRDGVERIGAAYGSATGVLEGRLERWADEVEITIPVQAAPGMLDRGLRNRIVVRQTDILAVELRQRDQTKTVALSLALGGAAAVTAIALFGGVFGGTPPPNEQLPEDLRAPGSAQPPR